MANSSHGPTEEQAPCLSNLTVENITKLELEYDAFDGERRKVEDYIRKNQQIKELKSSMVPLSPETQEQDLVKRETNTMMGDLHIYANRNERQTECLTDQRRKETSSTMQVTNREKFPYINVQTQTESNRLYVTTTSKNARIPDADDSDTKMSTSKVTKQGPVTSENTVERGTSEDGNKTLEQLPLSGEDDPPGEMEATLSFCEFCHLPKKPFPSIEQLASEPGSTLFCCVKIQELFQYMIMDTIESNTPEKTEEETEDEQTPALISDKMKALCELRKQIKNIDTKEYITSLANHLTTHGCLFFMEKISFTLASATDTIVNCVQTNDVFSDQAGNIDDYFIPIMDNELIKKPKETIKQCYSSGQNFLILFPDGTGQVLYPSGNIGILIVCSKPDRFIFIILEDTEKKPQIQAVFMSNGHAACYHLNGRLCHLGKWTPVEWIDGKKPEKTVLDPCGGSYFDENGIQKKHWTWWDFSQHVHAPPFQPITIMLNSNIEIKIIKQDQVYLSFTKDKEKVIYNVGAQLLWKDPEMTSKMKRSTGDTELYCSSKKLEIFSLLNKIHKLVRISAKSKDGEVMIQDNMYQLQKSLNSIITLTNRQENASNVLKTKEIQDCVSAEKKKPSPHPRCTLSSKTELHKGGEKKE